MSDYNSLILSIQNDYVDITFGGFDENVDENVDDELIFDLIDMAGGNENIVPLDDTYDIFSDLKKYEKYFNTHKNIVIQNIKN